MSQSVPENFFFPFVFHFAVWKLKWKAGQRCTLRGEHSSCQRELGKKQPTGGLELLFVIVFTRTEAGAGGMLVQDKVCCWNYVNEADVSTGCCTVGFKGGKKTVQSIFSKKAKTLAYLLEGNKQTRSDKISSQRQNQTPSFRQENTSPLRRFPTFAPLIPFAVKASATLEARLIERLAVCPSVVCCLFGNNDIAHQ